MICYLDFCVLQDLSVTVLEIFQNLVRAFVSSCNGTIDFDSTLDDLKVLFFWEYYLNHLIHEMKLTESFRETCYCEKMYD